MLFRTFFFASVLQLCALNAQSFQLTRQNIIQTLSSMTLEQIQSDNRFLFIGEGKDFYLIQVKENPDTENFLLFKHFVAPKMGHQLDWFSKGLIERITDRDFLNELRSPA